MKKEILELVITELEKSVKAMDGSLNTLETSADLDENATIDLDERSQQDQAIDLGQRLQQPRIDLQNNLNTLRQFEGVHRDDIGPGALVETDEKWYLIGVSLPPMEIAGKKILGVTTDAPSYAAQEGKKKGDALQLAGKTYLILSVQ